MTVIACQDPIAAQRTRSLTGQTGQDPDRTHDDRLAVATNVSLHWSNDCSHAAQYLSNDIFIFTFFLQLEADGAALDFRCSKGGLDDVLLARSV